MFLGPLFVLAECWYFFECYLPYLCLSHLFCLFESDVRWRCFLGKYFVAILVFVGGLSGCSTPSAIVLNDGRELQTLDTPRYDSTSVACRT